MISNQRNIFPIGERNSIIIRLFRRKNNIAVSFHHIVSFLFFIIISLYTLHVTSNTDSLKSITRNFEPTDFYYIVNGNNFDKNFLKS